MKCYNAKMGQRDITQSRKPNDFLCVTMIRQFMVTTIITTVNGMGELWLSRRDDGMELSTE